MKFIKYKPIKMADKLTMIKSPYLVEPSKKVQDTIKFAIKRGLFKKFQIDKKLMEDFLVSKSSISMWMVEAACRINQNDCKIPVPYQYLWFSLHGTKITRVQPSGRRFRSRVNFSSGYIQSDEKSKQLIISASKALNLSQEDFSILCGYKKGTIRFYKNKIPITAILKSSQILKIDAWDFLKGYNLFGKTSREGKITIPLLENHNDLNLILIWLKTEGHLELCSTHIEINQKNNIASLKKLKELIVVSFKLKEQSGSFSMGKRGEDRLIISSSPLRQFFCLRYNIPLGYKSGCLERTLLDGLSENDYKKLMPAFIQTEGCLSSHYTRNKKRKLPRFEFIVKDKSLAEDCIFVLKKLGFCPSFYEKNNLFKVGLYNSKEVIRLLNRTKQYFLNENKIEYLRGICTNDLKI